MRKTKQVLTGNVSFNRDGNRCTADIQNLGQQLKPDFGGMLDASLVNNRMFIIELQNEGLKMSHTFHYRLPKDKKKIQNERLLSSVEILQRFLKDNYGLPDVKCELSWKELYDEDYCSLPLEEAKKDLTSAELQEVMQELAHYRPTVKANRKKARKSDVFFE